ncbi:hypothetical protein PMAYCL1PPCAC_20554, partial [Pristionchus mayeri]
LCNFEPGSQYKGTFYTLFVATAFVDLVMSFSTHHEFRFAFFPLVNGMFANHDCGVCSTARIALSYICSCAQDFLNIFIALSRLTSIIYPVHHARIWKWLLPSSIIFSYLLATAIFSIT